MSAVPLATVATSLESKFDSWKSRLDAQKAEATSYSRKMLCLEFVTTRYVGLERGQIQ